MLYGVYYRDFNTEIYGLLIFNNEDTAINELSTLKEGRKMLSEDKLNYEDYIEVVNKVFESADGITDEIDTKELSKEMIKLNVPILYNGNPVKLINKISIDVD